MVTAKVTQTGIKTVIDNIKDIKKLGLGQFPHGAPPGTVPVGGGWYRTPDTPADPRDCARYPDSPWCGGNPFSTKPISLGISPKVHGCGFDVEVNGTIGFIKVPPARLAYRFEGECRNEPPPPPPPEPPKPGELSFNGFGNGPSDDSYVYAFITDSNGSYGDFSLYVTSDYKCPGNKNVPNAGVANYNAPVSCTWNQTITFAEGSVNHNTGTYDYGAGGFLQNIVCDQNGNYCYTQDSTGIHYDSNQKDNNFSPDISIPQYEFCIYKGKWADVKKAVYAYYNDRHRLYPYRTYQIDFRFAIGVDCKGCNPYFKNPPPDLPDPKNCCMACCNDPRDQSQDYSKLLKQILAEIQKANKAIGSDKWSSSKVPANLLVKDGLSNAQISITDINAWCEWYSKQFDSLMGRWKIDLEVEHPDPTDPKAKPIKMALPNLAESIAEMMGVMLHVSMNVDALTNVGTRTLIQSGQASQQAFTNWMLLNAIQEYMGFADEDDVREMVLTFKPNETDLSKLLKETHVKVKGVKYKKGTQRLRDALHDLLRGAAIISAVHWKKLDSNKKNYGQQLFDLISGTAGLVTKIGDPKNKITGDSDFDQFIKDFEEGFIEHTGLDKDRQTTPYGRPYDERPQVKKLGKNPSTNTQGS